MMFVAVFGALIYIWRGDFHHAKLLADEATERAQQLGNDHMRAVAITVQTAVAAYIERENETRAAGQTALDLARQRGSPRLADWSTINLGFLEVTRQRSTADAVRTCPHPAVPRPTATSSTP